MPYIEEKCRERYESVGLNNVCSELAHSGLPGELAYCVYRLMRAYVRGAGKTAGYAVMAIAVGTVTTAVHEFERCVLWPYEDNKRTINGDVF